MAETNRISHRIHAQPFSQYYLSRIVYSDWLYPSNAARIQEVTELSSTALQKPIEEHTENMTLIHCAGKPLRAVARGVYALATGMIIIPLHIRALFKETSRGEIKDKHFYLTDLAYAAFPVLAGATLGTLCNRRLRPGFMPLLCLSSILLWLKAPFLVAALDPARAIFETYADKTRGSNVYRSIILEHNFGIRFKVGASNNLYREGVDIDKNQGFFLSQSKFLAKKVLDKIGELNGCLPSNCKISFTYPPKSKEIISSLKQHENNLRYPSQLDREMSRKRLERDFRNCEQLFVAAKILHSQQLPHPPQREHSYFPLTKTEVVANYPNLIRSASLDRQ